MVGVNIICQYPHCDTVTQYTFSARLILMLSTFLKVRLNLLKVSLFSLPLQYTKIQYIIIGYSHKIEHHTLKNKKIISDFTTIKIQDKPNNNSILKRSS